MQKIKELVLATHNPGKFAEISELLGPYVPKLLSAGDLSLPEPEETGETFAENALIKAHAAAQESGYPALADDSGLAVTSLDGAPGIYSARWGGPDKDFQVAMARVNEELHDNADRSAAFVCVLALVWPDGAEETFEGRIEGRIIWPPRGDKGFGYDPIFVPDGYDKTFAEIEHKEKQKISHRARAFLQLVERCFREDAAQSLIFT